MTLSAPIAFRLLRILAAVLRHFQRWCDRVERLIYWVEDHRGPTVYEAYRAENPRESGGWTCGGGNGGEPVPGHLCKTCGVELPPGKVRGVKVGFCSKDCQEGKAAGSCEITYKHKRCHDG